ncbi:MAG: hypothetical protein ACLP1Y_02455 [Candidatus Acidiferrales bacterium]
MKVVHKYEGKAREEIRAKLRRWAFNREPLAQHTRVDYKTGIPLACGSTQIARGRRKARLQGKELHGYPKELRQAGEAGIHWIGPQDFRNYQSHKMIAGDLRHIRRIHSLSAILLNHGGQSYGSE